MPPGWQTLWDPVGQRWAYLESWNSKVAWTVPTGPSYPQGGDASRGYESGTPQGGYTAYAAPPAGAPAASPYGALPGAHQEVKADKPAKNDSKNNLMMGAAGGLAVGAISGALVANALGKFFPLFF